MPAYDSEDPVGLGWHRLPWTAWQPFGPAAEETLPSRPGVYRLRLRGAPDLLYVGQASNIRSRLRRHRVRAHIANAPQAPAWARSIPAIDGALARFWIDGTPVELGAAPVDISGDAEERFLEMVETDLICSYRAARDSYPVCQFGRGRRLPEAGTTFGPA